MDGQAFDRLTMTVSRLRERATRRGALKAGIGAVLGAASIGAAVDAEARRRDRDRERSWGWGNWGCRYNGTYCTSSNQCCNGSCRGNICGGRIYPGKRCGYQTCADGWKDFPHKRV